MSYYYDQGAIDLHPRRHTAPVLGRAYADQVLATTELEDNLRYQLEQQRKEAVHFKVVAQDLERNLASVRETNQRNLQAWQRLSEAYGGMVPEFQVQGNFTICLLVDPLSERVFTGATCCGRDDSFNLEIGKAISLGRAMAQRAEFFANNAYDRSAA